MNEAHFQIVRLAGYVVAGGFALALQRRRPHARLSGSVRVNAGLWLLNAAVLSVVCGACACSVARWATAHGVGFLNSIAAPAWVGVPLTIAALDFVSYGWHRANHRLSFLWRFHQVHHSDLGFTVSTGVRFHPGELLLSLPIRLSAVVSLGAPAGAVVFFEVVFTVANLFEHGNINLPLALERRLAGLVVTPALHRRHHTRRYPELDSNFGTIFTLWDRCLRTYGENSSATRVETGLPNGENALTVRRALLLPLRASRASTCPCSLS
ncbi:MAG TPA: sterol desaturase family protein [Candidatus Margulisiibacteriota bacterium]|nr:sterol desaturase family protein [Candidatus Margulisiibacteriota bacterium]